MKVMNVHATRAQSRRVPLAASVVCTLVGAGALSVFAPTSPAASAAEVNGVVTGVSMKNESSSTGPNVIWDEFSADLTFDTTGKNVAEGDTLMIQLPRELRTRSANFDVIDKNGGGVALKCSVPAGTGQIVNCVFTDYVKTHINAKGDIHVRADMAMTTTTDRFTFTIGHSVTIEAKIDRGNVVSNKYSWVPKQPWKYGWQLHEGHNERFTWEIHIPAKSVQGSVITVTDTFDTANGGYKLFNDGKKNQQARLLKWNTTEAYRNDPYHQKPSQLVWVGGSINGGTFTMTETANGFVASFPKTDDDAIYELKYYTELNTPEGLKIGNVFKNTAVINGQTAVKDIEIETVGWGNVEGQLKTTPPTPSVTTPPVTTPPTPPATTVTPSPSVSTTEATPSPSTSTTPSPKTPLARTGAMTAPAIGLGVLGLALGAALIRRRQQA